MPRPTFRAVLLIDGYNMVGSWPDLKSARDRLGLEEARHQLIQLLLGYSVYQQYNTQIIFDAHYQGNPGSQEQISPHVAIQYTSYRQTADTYIEKTCAAFRHDLRRFEQRLIVATSDRAQQLTVMGYNAECMSAEKLLADIEAIAHRVQRQKSSAKASSRRLLSSRLDPAAQAKLAKLRLGLPTDLPPQSQRF
ncbi:MAG TPA: NYN domain-containing protein [Candidatus Obscuribacterales bacterium]